MREDGGPTGDGTAPAVYGVPALERSHATLPAALWAWSCFRPEALIVPVITSIVRRPLPGRAAARGADPLTQEGAPVPVPATVEPPAGRFTAWVVRT
ncbi:MAG TPA: hypothetical protein VMH35_26515 [Streptosporangiaceae bacterium]|nr:hypothetical protein [Streptosporangiaceae bacterium]